MAQNSLEQLLTELDAFKDKIQTLWLEQQENTPGIFNASDINKLAAQVEELMSDQSDNQLHRLRVGKQISMIRILIDRNNDQDLVNACLQLLIKLRGDTSIILEIARTNVTSLASVIANQMIRDGVVKIDYEVNDDILRSLKRTTNIEKATHMTYAFLEHNLPTSEDTNRWIRNVNMLLSVASERDTKDFVKLAIISVLFEQCNDEEKEEVLIVTWELLTTVKDPITAYTAARLMLENSAVIGNVNIAVVGLFRIVYYEKVADEIQKSILRAINDFGVSDFEKYLVNNDSDALDVFLAFWGQISYNPKYKKLLSDNES